MITTLFIIFLVVSFALIGLGKYLRQPPIVLSGFFFIFILGMVLLLGGLSYASGETITYGYVCSCCENGTYTEGGLTPEYYCAGTPHACDYYDGDAINCVAAGCDYNDTTLLCGGTPYDCDTYLIQRDCEAVACEWLPGQTYTGCENGTSITTKNQTTTPTYTSYDNEIVEGLQIHHLLGFFLLITAILGWIITLTDLESFQPESVWGRRNE
jgi:energy-coupling factor transporter transmembrane protein EcfT